MQSRIAFGVLGFQRHVDTDEAGAALDADLLGGDGDVREARAGDFAMRHEPDGGASMPPLTLSHSTTTAPLNLASSVGRRTTIRVV